MATGNDHRSKDQIQRQGIDDSTSTQMDNISIKDHNSKYDTPPIGGSRPPSTKSLSDDEQQVVTTDNDFDWDDADPEDEVCLKEARHHRHCFLLPSRSSSKLSWLYLIVFTIISVAVNITVFVTVKPQTDPTMKSYNLAIWFTFIASMFCITFLMQIFIEVIPWVIKKIAVMFAPHKSEVLRARFSYYMAMRTYIKLVGIGAWSWGSWAIIRRQLGLPQGSIRPDYVKTLEYAYGDRLSKNERALTILDKLKRVKRTPTQDFLLKRIKKKCCDKRSTSKNSVGSTATTANEDYNGKKGKSDNEGDSEKIQAEEIEDNKNKKQGRFKGLYRRMCRTKSTDRLEEEKAEDMDEAEEERNDRNLEDYEEHQGRPRFLRCNTSISSLTTSTTSSEKSLFDSHHLFRGYQKLVKESAFQDPVHQAKHLARRIYHNIMGPNPVRQYLIEADLYPYFRTLNDAKEAFELFDTDANGDISRREMRAGCIRIYRDRKDLARSMRDMSQATGKLDIILVIVFICIWIIVVLAVFGINVGTQLMPLWSAFIAASFIFGNSAKDAFESIIFVFVTHPFDTGDRIMVGTENWIVSNVGLLVSTFIKWDGSVIYAKNSVLATQYIINCRRTGCMSESFEIHISYHTPSWKIQALRDHMVKWNNKFPKLFTKDACGANIVAFENLNRITISFYFEHTKNWQDSSGRWLRHNNFMLELKDELQRLDIKYSKPEQPVIHKYDDGEEIIDNKEFEYEDGKPRKRTPWSETCNYQNQSGGSSGNGPGVSGDGSDVGASAGAAATVAFTTGAF